MNARHRPEVLIGTPEEQQSQPLVNECALRQVWEGRFARILIEVIDGVIYVNGEPVEAADGSKE